MKIVVFGKRGYAIRRFNWFKFRYEYANLLKHYPDWIDRNHFAFYELCLDKLPTVKNKLEEIVDYGVPV